MFSIPSTFKRQTARHPFAAISSAGPNTLPAGVVDEQVEPPVALEHGADHPPRIAGIANVTDNRAHLGAHAHAPPHAPPRRAPPPPAGTRRPPAPPRPPRPSSRQAPPPPQAREPRQQPQRAHPRAARHPS